jgi:hypothetical protein
LERIREKLNHLIPSGTDSVREVLFDDFNYLFFLLFLFLAILIFRAAFFFLLYFALGFSCAGDLICVLLN